MAIEELARSVASLDAKRDPLFLNYAVETKRIRELRDPTSKAFIGVGVKGVGKSSAFQILAQKKQPSDLVIAIDPARYSVGGEVDQDSVSRFSTKTRIGILYEILKQIVEHKRDLERFIDASSLQNAVITYERIWEKAKKLFDIRGISIFGCGVTLGSSVRESLGSKVSFFVEESEERDLIEVIDRCAKQISVYLLVDDPEAIFFRGESFNKNFVAGFILASRDVSDRLLNFKPIVLLKPGVLESIRFTDDFANLPYHSITYLSWDLPELEQVLQRRLEYTKVPRDAVFKGAEPFRLIVDSIRNGPRDLLSRVDIALEETGGGPITSADIEMSQPQYHEYCLTQFLGAYSEIFPGIDVLLDAIFEEDL